MTTSLTRLAFVGSQLCVRKSGGREPDWTTEAPLAGCTLSWTALAEVLRLHAVRHDGGRRANLSGADLSGANLRGTCLSGAYLSGTCLDPAAPVPPITDAQIAAAGLAVIVIDGVEWLEGWRSRRSRHIGSTDYSAPGEYVAPWLSVDQATDCHPGIYLGGSASEHGDDRVRARCRRDEGVFVSTTKGVRTRRLVRDAATSGMAS